MLLATVSSGLHQVTRGVSDWFRSIGVHVGPLDVAALVIATVILAFYAVFLILRRPNRDLAETLERYRIRREEPPPQAQGSAVVTLSFLRRLADALTRLAEKRELRQTLEVRLAKAGLPIGVGELLVVWLLGGAVLLLLGAVAGGVVGFIFACVITVISPPATLQYLGDRRRRRFDSQLSDVLKLLAASLRAGFSLLQGLDAILEQVTDPIASELRQAFAATRVGASVEDALQAAADRVGSQDFSWSVMAIRIQREAGGNLSEILDTVARTMTEREKLRREVRTLTAEGRLSAVILLALPVAIGMLVYVVNRSYIDVLFQTLAGQLALVGALALEIVGGWWLYRTVQIDL